MPDKKVRVLAPIPTLPKPYIYVVIYVRVSIPTEDNLEAHLIKYLILFR